MNAREQAWLDQEDERIKMAIREYGWWITYVGGGFCSHPDCGGGEIGEPPLAYTTGLFGLGHPEPVVTGVDMATASGLLNTAGERVRNGDTVMPGIELTFNEWPGHRVIAEVVPNPGEIVFEANRFYQRPPEASVPVLQLTYTDKNGLYPWDEGCLRRDLQPRPGTWHA